MIENKKTIRSLLGIIFLDQTYITITFPLITLLFFDTESRLFANHTNYETRSLWYGLCISLPSIINIFFAPLLSAMSDEFGRKKILLIEIFSAFIFTFLVGFGVYTGQLEWIFFGFIIRGAFSRTNPTALTMMGDIAPRSNKILYMGYLQFAIAIGATLGPILGGFFASRFAFATLNFSLPFFLAAGLAIINTCLAYKLLQETLVKVYAKQVNQFNLQAIKKVLVNPTVLQISLLLLLIQLSWSAYYQFIPPILKTIYGFNASELGIFIGMIACWLAVATGLLIKPLHRYLNNAQLLLFSVYLILIGLILTFLSCVGLFGDAKWTIWLGAMPVATGDVIAYSALTALYSNAVLKDQQGKVMGVGFIIVSSAWAITGFLGGFLMSITPLLPLIIAPCGVITAIFLMHSHFKQKLVLCEEMPH